jgi:hypothetical protein
MRTALAYLACAAGVFAASPAHACWSVESNRVVFTREPPANVPSGLSVFKVEVPSNLRQDDYYPIEVRVLDGPKVVADRLLIIPGRWTECTAWGAIAGSVYVMGTLTCSADGKVFLTAVQRRQ